MRKRYVVGIIIFLTFILNSFIEKGGTNISNQIMNADSLIKKEIVSEANDFKLYKVIRVADGDTIVISMNNIEERIRLLGVNTPESVDPRKTVQCFGKEASIFTNSLLEGRSVYVDQDETQEKRDRYGRLLSYIYRDDGLFVNKNIIENGYGYEYTYKDAYKYQREFKTAQIYAEKNEYGLWSKSACVK